VRLLPKRITEGKTVLEIPTDQSAFFNPEMKLNRDITVSIVQAWKNKRSVCDALAATGAKGIRIANETKAKEVVLNDLNPNAVKLIKKNIRLNKLKNCKVESKDANILLSEHTYAKFNIIDIDPFGPPVQFIDSACRAILPKDALLCVTATDTGALCGTFQKACMRKYGIKAKKTTFYNEFGMRALIAFCVREAAKYDIGLEPVFSHATKHYYRTFLKTNRGRTAADKAMKKVGMIGYCYKCDYRAYNTYGKHCARDLEILGPIWQGKLYGKALLKKLKPNSKEAEKLIARCIEEADFTTPYYNIHQLSKKWGKPLPKFDTIIKKVGNASRTHFNPRGIKTDADFDKLKKAL